MRLLESRSHESRRPRRPWRPLLLACLALLTITLAPRVAVHADTPAAAPVFGDSRFGVYLNGDPQQLATLGTRWYITMQPDSPPPPPNAVWVQYVSLQAGQTDDLAQRVAQSPGSSWLIGNEPNVKGSPDELSGEQYARALHDAVGVIHATDPSASIVGPNIINFDFTCIACPGFTSGHAWMGSFLAAYSADYGTLPPIDIWSIHTYPLDFEHFPQVDASTMEQQLTEFRAYLDATPGLSGAPIWDTEIGTHWGYEGLEWRDDGTGTVKAFPVGAYRSDLLLGYMQNLLGWLAQNGPSLNIDRWFFYVSYENRPEAWETTYAGINLLDGFGPNAQLTPFGQLYRQLAGLPPQ
jgi:hypothetical protein